jgi:hypothetical protein
MNDDVVPPERTVKDIVLNEIDRDIVRMAARLLMALDPGETRENAGEEFIQKYRDDLARVHPGADPEVLDEMTITFAGALLLEMERVGLAHATDDEAGHA